MITCKDFASILNTAIANYEINTKDKNKLKQLVQKTHSKMNHTNGIEQLKAELKNWGRKEANGPLTLDELFNFAKIIATTKLKDSSKDHKGISYSAQAFEFIKNELHKNLTLTHNDITCLQIIKDHLTLKIFKLYYENRDYLQIKHLATLANQAVSEDRFVILLKDLATAYKARAAASATTQTPQINAKLDVQETKDSTETPAARKNSDNTPKPGFNSSELQTAVKIQQLGISNPNISKPIRTNSQPEALPSASAKVTYNPATSDLFAAPKAGPSTMPSRPLPTIPNPTSVDETDSASKHFRHPSK